MGELRDTTDWNQEYVYAWGDEGAILDRQETIYVDLWIINSLDCDASAVLGKHKFTSYSRTQSSSRVGSECQTELG